MKRKSINYDIFIVIAIFVGVSITFYHYTFLEDFNDKFLGIATFLFTIFTGFFVSRQGTRYSKIRQVRSIFDGELSGAYRVSSHLGKDFQKRFGVILKKHYRKILDNQAWDYHFTRKSTTITELNQLMEDGETEGFPDTKMADRAMDEIATVIVDIQSYRKRMIALHQERIPILHWFMICLFAGLLSVAVTAIPTEGKIFESILKGAYITSVVSVLFVLHRLDTLRLFEGTVGEHSAEDVLAIIAGKR